MGVDNCYIDVDAPEFPILDGSAIEYVRKIKEVGLVSQELEREYYIVKQRTEVVSEDGRSRILLLPDHSFGVDVHISFDSPILSNQFASLDNLKKFETEIAASRTFVFVREIEQLLAHNLVKGGDLDNALVIYDKEMEQSSLNDLCKLMGVEPKKGIELGYINNAPIIFPTEPARHKLLDVLGDLSLIGRPIQGRIIATCPGHKINNEMGQKIRREIKQNESQAPIYDPNKEPLMDVKRIQELLPHRYPFLLVDKIIERGSDYVVGIKNVTANESFFQGHFPGEPDSYSTYFLKIDNVKFRQKVVPGDTLIFKVRLVSEMRRGMANMRGLAFVGETLVCECDFMAQIVKNK